MTRKGVVKIFSNNFKSTNMLIAVAVHYSCNCGHNSLLISSNNLTIEYCNCIIILADAVHGVELDFKAGINVTKLTI